MSDNANNRKKTLIISMLLFLLGGGGIFLFFIIQGSNDLTGAGKNNFQYGTATRGAVSSFFKVLGFDDTEPLSKSAKVRVEARGLLEDGPTPPKADVSDWMAKDKSDSRPAPARSASTVVPRMGGRGTSGVGGLGGGGTQSSGGVSRFGDGAGGGNARITNTAAGSAGANGKGTLGALTNARAMLGEGLRSGSAMTAKSSWDRSFGVGSASTRGGPSMAYGKSGLVSLDKIKKGEVDNLKTTDIKSLKTPEPGAFKEDKDAEAGDSVLKKAKEEADAEAAKKAAAQALASAAGNALNNTSGTASTPKSTDKSTDRAAGDDDLKVDGEKVPPKVVDSIKGGLCPKDCSTTDGQSYTDNKMNITKNADGSYNCVYSGTQVNPTDSSKNVTYSDTVRIEPDGTRTLIDVKENPLNK